MTPEEADELYRNLRSLPTPHQYEHLAAALSDALARVSQQEQEIEGLQSKVAELENADLDALKDEVAELTQRLCRLQHAFRNLYNAVPSAKTNLSRKELQAKHMKYLSI